MTSKKEKKIQKLRRAHVWPSVIMLLVSLIMAAALPVATTFLFLGMNMHDQFLTSSDNADAMVRVIEQKIGSGISYEEAVNSIASEVYKTDAVYVLDKDGSALAGFGEKTFEKSLGSLNGANVFSDSTAEDVIRFDFNGSSASSMVVDVTWMTQSLFEDLYKNKPFNFNPSNEWLNEVKLHYPYWIQKSGTEEGEKVFIRSYIDIRRKDTLYCIIISAVAMAFMLLPAVMMFINAIANFISQKRMAKLLFFDTVTGGNNWFYFETTAGKKLKSLSAANKMYAIVDFSVVKYRSYCNFHGARAGEELLEQIDSYFDTAMRAGEIFAHSGKASFALLMRCDSEEECNSRVEKIMNDIPVRLKNDHAMFHAGICFIPPQSSGQEYNRRNLDVNELYNRACTARASIEAMESSGAALFGQKLLEDQLWEHKVEENMQAALENNEFQVYVQPKYNPATDELVGGEALIRWISPTDGFIGPGKFIPIFEKNGFITRIDDYMISSVSALQAKWRAEGKKVVPISVNVSRAHFARPDLAEHICRLVDEHRVPHNLVEIELTESAFFDDKSLLLNTVKKLKGFGFEISMDDFGAGYSSLNSLKDLPLDVLKLDAEFFRGESEEERGEIVVSKAIQLAKSLNMRIVAEGVEKKDQVEFLANNGCDMIQGFYYAKPMPTNEFEERMSPAEA